MYIRTKFSKRILFGIFMVLGLVSVMTAVQPVLAASNANQQEVCNAIGTGTDCSGGTNNGASSINKIITNAVTIFSAVVGLTAVIMAINAGFRYVTSGGEAGKIAAAKTTLIYALVGVAVASLAQLMVKFVINKASK